MPRDTMELAAGRELDALVAERVMGWVWRRSNVTGRRCLYRENRWPEWMDTAADGTEALVGDWHLMSFGDFSTDIAAAWEVIEKVSGDWSVTISGGGVVYVVRLDDHYEDRVFEAPTLPLAICRAALAAVEVDDAA